MATGLTDRGANMLLNQGRVASNVDIANPQLLVQQLDQRHMTIQVLVATTALTAGVTYRFNGWVADRAYQVISARFISTSTITPSSTSYVSINLVSNNDAGGADTYLAVLKNVTTSLLANQSQALTVQGVGTSTGNTIAAGQQVDMLFGFAAAGQIFPTGTGLYVLDVVVQEV
jgi:hypothetical protein